MVTEWADEWQVKEKTNASRRFEVHWVTDIPEALRNKDEAYTLHISREHIHIEAIKPQGVYRAMQTLRQLTERSEQGVRVHGCRITDWPAFRIRGWMHDVGCSYISLKELKREIVLLSRYKINTFHWHLTENQAWRLESKRYPELNDSAHTTRMPGKYYTHEEARELVDFCRKHFVTLIPEIDIPGHSAAFERALDYGIRMISGKNGFVLSARIAPRSRGSFETERSSGARDDRGAKERARTPPERSFPVNSATVMPTVPFSRSRS